MAKMRMYFPSLSPVGSFFGGGEKFIWSDVVVGLVGDVGSVAKGMRAASVLATLDGVVVKEVTEDREQTIARKAVATKISE